MVIRVSDDLNRAVNSENAEITAVTLGYNSHIVELDLGPENREWLEKFLQEFMAAGKQVAEHHRARQVGGAMSPAEIGRQLREFADERGIPYTKYGTSYKYPLELRQQFALETGLPMSMLNVGKRATKDG